MTHQTFNPVVTAPALTVMNAMSRKNGTAAALAYLKGEYPDMRELFVSIEGFIADTGGDVRDPDAYGIADEVCKAAVELMETCEMEAV